MTTRQRQWCAVLLLLNLLGSPALYAACQVGANPGQSALPCDIGASGQSQVGNYIALTSVILVVGYTTYKLVQHYRHADKVALLEKKSDSLAMAWVEVRP